MSSLKNTGFIFPEIFFIQYFTIFKVVNLTLPNLHNTKNVNISKMKKDIPKRETPFLLFLKMLSNKQQLFFTCTPSYPYTKLMGFSKEKFNRFMLRLVLQS